MGQKHLFIIDPLETLNLALDSSLRMMFALATRGEEIHVCQPRHLEWLCSDQATRVRCQRVTFAGDATGVAEAGPQTLSLQEFAAIHMRKDPPYDMDYVATTWLLDPVRKVARIYNDSEALRRYNEKLAMFQFPEDCKAALVSSDPDTLLAFAGTGANGDAILKPLDLFGGRGVRRLKLGGIDGISENEAREVLAVETAGGTRLRLIQAFDPAVFQGEVRVFCAFGEPLAWCLKRPAPGNYLANTRAGATLEKYQPSALEVERVQRVAAALKKKGVMLIGFDLIGGYVSEINLTSPRLLQAPGDEGRYYDRFAELVLEDLHGR